MGIVLVGFVTFDVIRSGYNTSKYNEGQQSLEVLSAALTSHPVCSVQTSCTYDKKVVKWNLSQNVAYKKMQKIYTVLFNLGEICRFIWGILYSAALL